MRRYTGFGWLELVVGVLLIILGIATFTTMGSVLTGVICSVWNYCTADRN